LEVQIAGMPVTASRGGKGEALKWTAVYQLTGEEENGEVTFSITGYEDEAGNAASSVNTTTDGSSVTFDKSAPIITGVEDGARYSTDVTPEFTDGTATLNGGIFVSGTVVQDENTYTLIAMDAAGNADTVIFVIDKTAPVISGVKDSVSYNKDVTVSFNEGTAVLNGDPFTSGTTIRVAGEYTLVVTDE